MRMTMEEIEKSPETVQQPKPKKSIRADKRLGYIAIGCSILLAILIIAIRVGLACRNSGSSGSVVAEAKTLSEDKIEEEAIVIPDATEAVSVDEIKTPDTGGGDAIGAEHWHFYNNDLQDDGEKLNDYNFGPNPILENVSLDKVKDAIKGKKASDTVKVEDIIEMLDVEELKKNHIERIYDDPKLGAANMAWADSILGTRYLGTFYSAAKEQWDVAMNDAADQWIEDAEEYSKKAAAFERKLDRANKVEIRYKDSGLTDQMYMEPDGKDVGIPDIIVMETDKHSGWFIVYTYIIKETKTLELMYRIDCGYQPTNVAEVMKIKARKNPNKKEKKKKTSTPTPTPTPAPTPVVTTPAPVMVTGGGSSSSSSSSSHHHHSGGTVPIPTPIPVPDPPDPTPVVPVNPIPTPPKDPTEGSNSDPNDGPGVGKNTNNPANPNFSTEDQETNSNHTTPEEYNQAIEDSHWANEIGREGGDSNEPSTPPPSEDTHEDNNGGDMDEQTDRSDSSVDHDSPGDHWDSPPD